MVQYTLCATTFSNITSCDVNVMLRYVMQQHQLIGTWGLRLTEPLSFIWKLYYLVLASVKVIGHIKAFRLLSRCSQLNRQVPVPSYKQLCIFSQNKFRDSWSSKPMSILTSGRDSKVYINKKKSEQSRRYLRFLYPLMGPVPSEDVA